MIFVTIGWIPTTYSECVYALLHYGTGQRHKVFTIYISQTVQLGSRNLSVICSRLLRDVDSG